jgi:hypothetical protein
VLLPLKKILLVADKKYTASFYETQNLSAETNRKEKERSNPMQDERGMVSPKTVAIVILLMLIIYLGFLFITPWVNYFSMKDALSQVIKLSKTQVLSDKEIKREILKKARELQITLTEQDILVKRQGDKINVTVEYEEVVSLPLGLERPMFFTLEM